MYRAGVKKYGKDGMKKIQSAAGKGASAEEIGKIKDKHNKKKKEPQLSIEDIKESDILEDKNVKIKSEDLEIFSEAIKFSKNHKDKRVEKIFEMRYITGERNRVMPWKKISEELNMSIQGCINIHNSAIEKFKIELKDKDYV